MRKRVFSWILVIAMLLAITPGMAFSASADAGPSIEEISITLGSVLGLNFYVNPGNATDSTAYSLRLSVDTYVKEVTAIEQEDGQWRFTVPLLAHRLHQNMKIELLNGTDVADSREGYNISSYINQIDAQTYGYPMYNLVQALSTYGTHAANYAAKTSADALTSPYMDGYASKVSAYTDKELAIGAYLNLDEACDIHFYFNKDCADTKDYTLYLDGEECNDLSVNGARYEYSLSGILPQDWGLGHTVEVKDASANVVFKLENYSALSYVYTRLKANNAADEASGLNNLLRAMYTYSAAAADYRQNSGEGGTTAIETLSALFDPNKEVVEVAPIPCTISNGENLHFLDFIIKDGIYYAYYIDTDTNGNSCVGLATSTNSVDFKDQGIVIPCDNTEKGAYEAFAGAYYLDGVFYLVYEYYNGTDPQSIRLATSTDGYTFTKYGEDIITKGEAGTWYSSNVGTPDLVWANNQWYVFFHGYNGDDCQIGVAYGEDLTNLTVHPYAVIPTSDTATDPDSGTTGRRDIVYVGGYYYMTYEISTDKVGDSYDGSAWTHTYARSTDLINWTSCEPLVTQKSSGMGYDGPNWHIDGENVYVYYRTAGNNTYRAQLKLKDSVEAIEDSNQAAVKVRTKSNGAWYATSLESYKGQSDAWVPVYMPISEISTGEFWISSNVTNYGNYTPYSLDLYSTPASGTAITSAVLENNRWSEGTGSPYKDRNVIMYIEVSADGSNWTRVSPVESTEKYQKDGRYETTVVGAFNDVKVTDSTGKTVNCWYGSYRKLTLDTIDSTYKYARVWLNLSVGEHLGVDTAGKYESAPQYLTGSDFATFMSEPEPLSANMSAVKVRVNGNWYGAYLRDYLGQDDIWVPVNIDITKLNANAVNYINITSNVTNKGNYSDSSIDLYSTFTSTGLESLVTNHQWCDDWWQSYSDRNINIQLQVYDGTQWITVAPTEVTSDRDEHLVIGYFADNNTWYNSGRNMNIGNIDFSVYTAARVLLHMHVGSNLEFPSDYVQDDFATFINDPA